MISYRTPVFSQDLDVGTLNSQSRSFASAVLKDVTNKTFPCLSLPEETTDTLYQGVEELLLQLSLSQTQMTTDKNSKSEAYSRLDSERPKNMVETVFKVNSAGQYQLSTKMDAAIDNKEIIIANELVSPAASQSTGSTDLFLPSAKHLKSTRGDNRFSVDKSYQGKRSSNKSPLLSGGKKNSKSKNITVSDKDVQAAIGLTVATAETLVIADIMNGCRMCQYLGPKGILDAALVLRRERDASGLNDFMLQDQQGTSLADSRWEEDLDDTVLEAECFGTLPTVSLEKATCRNTSRLANMQSHVRLKTEKAVEAAKELGRTTRSTAARHSDAQYEESSTSIGEVMQGRMTHPLPAIDNKQAVAPQESFNSRWLGGWTGVKCAEGQQACLKEGQLEKKRNNSLKYETSELSETCGLPPPAENLSSCFRDVQMKSAKCSVDAMPEGDAEALSTGSCAEILLALSQASIKYSCSLQEPLCSFVPCSVNLTVKPPIAQPPRCNDAESAENMTKNGTAIGLVSGDKDKMGIQSNLLESSPARGTKRTCLDSLRKHSTISSNLEGTLQPSESYCPKLIQEERSLLIGNDADVAVNTARSLVPPNKSVQCQLILEDFTLQDSPPLIWHRSKRRRLRACRIAESDLIQGISSDSLSGYPPVAGEPANCLEPENINSQNREHVRQTRKDEVHILEPENMKSEECEHIRETRKDVQLLSHGNQLSTRNHGEPRLPQDQPYKVSGIGQCHLEVLEVVNTKQKAYKRRERNGSTCQIFNGVRFLVTGFSAGQKNIIEDLSKKIQDHGGVIMSSIPSLSNLNGRRTLPRQCTTTLHSVVIAPQKVRTLKYLYGCAAGLLIVKPIWLDEMIAKKGLRFNHNYKGKKTIKQVHFLECPDRQQAKELIFRSISAYVHGQRSYCLKLSLLIQHGAGKVVRSVKGLMQVKDESLIRVVVAEHQSKLPQIVKETAGRSGLPIVSGDWIINSLLSGRRLPLHVAVEPSKTVKVARSFKIKTSKTCNVAKTSQDIEGAVSSAKTTLDTVSAPHKEDNIVKPSVSCLGHGGAFPALSSMGLSFVLDVPKHSASGKVSSRIYYKSISMNGMTYTAGDIVEVRPETGEVNQPYVAQIESFYAAHANSMNTRSAKQVVKEKTEKPCFLCCRWFYRPSDTVFCIVGNDKELFLSQHFDDNAPVYSVIKKVQVLLVVGEKAFINDAERGWKEAMQASGTGEPDNYVCRFFYDYQKESLHQLKAALTSEYPV